MRSIDLINKGKVSKSNVRVDCSSSLPFASHVLLSLSLHLPFKLKKIFHYYIPYNYDTILITYMPFHTKQLTYELYNNHINPWILHFHLPIYNSIYTKSIHRILIQTKFILHLTLKYHYHHVTCNAWPVKYMFMFKNKNYLDIVSDVAGYSHIRHNIFLV